MSNETKVIIVCYVLYVIFVAVVGYHIVQRANFIDTPKVRIKEERTCTDRVCPLK